MQLFCNGVLLHFKVLQKHIVHEDLGPLWSQVMSPSLNAINYYEQIFSWIGHLSWALIIFLFSNVKRFLSYINTPPITNPLVLMSISNNLEKFRNFNTCAIESFLRTFQACFFYSSCHSNDNSFLKRFLSGLADVEKSFMNFLWKLANPWKDLIPLIMT
jgi:hypothetical protein